MQLITKDAPKKSKSQERRDTRRERDHFARAYRAENRYRVQLSKIARHIGDIVQAFDPNNLTQMRRASALLNQYAETITPWAEATANAMLADVSQRDERAWNEYTKGMAEGMREALRHAPVGQVYRDLMAEQITLIKSLPLEASQRVHELATKNMIEGGRDSNIISMIMNTGHVTLSRAKTIARTETARASSNFTRARASFVGSEQYIWRTSLDPEVRLSHRKLEGKVFYWNDPPVCDAPNLRANPGCVFNCFTGDTLVPKSLGLLVFRSSFKGRLFKVFTGNTFFEATPNHPVLTTEGPKPVGMLQQGDYLVCMNTGGFNTVDKNVDNDLISFKDLFESSSLMRETKKGSIFNFHGDLPEDNVEIVRTEKYLSLNIEACALQSLCDNLIPLADRAILGIDVVRSFAQINQSSSTRTRNFILASLLSGLLRNKYVSLVPGSSWNVVTVEKLLNSHIGDAVLSRQYWGASSSLVGVDDFLLRELFPVVGGSSATRDYSTTSLDLLTKINTMATQNDSHFLKQLPFAKKLLRVDNITSRNSSEHVFTMETESNWFSITSEAVLAKNCRCYPEIILPRQYD